ncbi:MAG TPA: LEA type 2 family protein [Casimicrobiaceae bacterium]|nr:LEA type 2 family protein [Casimicrobiaceae bacterium]
MSGMPHGIRACFAALLCYGLVIAGCATLPIANPPSVEVTGVALDRVEGPDAYFNVDLTLESHADRELVVDALDGTLRIEGEDIAQAKLVDGPVHLPAHGTANATMTARTGMDALLRAVADAMRRGTGLSTPGAHLTLKYTLEARASIAGGGRFSFRRDGELGERKR